MFDMFGMMGKIKEAQEKMKMAQDNLVNIVTLAESGDGKVKVTANGKRQILKLEIEDSLYADKKMLSDLVLLAVNKAVQQADELAKESLKKSMEGTLPQIPGVDLDNLFNR